MLLVAGYQVLMMQVVMTTLVERVVLAPFVFV
jgi:hypothetical protein